MSTKNPYCEWLKQDMGSLIDALEVSDSQKEIKKELS
jgi:hypothetical protein